MNIRIARKTDAEKLLEIYAPYVANTAITFEYDVPTKDEFKNRITETLKRYPYIVAENDDEIVGYAYAGAFKERAAYDRAAELSVYVRCDMKKKGIGKRLYSELEKLLAKQGILNVEACIAYPDGEDDEYLDKNSAEFHEHMGYRMVGEFRKCGYKFGRWYNMVWMEKFIGKHNDEPSEFICFSKL